MITKISTVSLFVTDQQRAKEFYVNKLGWDLRAEAPLYPGAEVKWLAVAPSGAQTELILYLPDENWSHYQQVVGQSQAITLEVEDIKATCAELKAKGVAFLGEPDVQPWGSFVMMVDSEDNKIILVQQTG